MKEKTLKRRMFTIEQDTLLLSSILESYDAFAKYDDYKLSSVFWKHVAYLFNYKNISITKKNKDIRQLKSRLRILFLYYKNNFEKNFSYVEMETQLENKFMINLIEVFKRVHFSSTSSLVLRKNNITFYSQIGYRLNNKPYSIQNDLFVYKLYSLGFFPHYKYDQEIYKTELLKFWDSEIKAKNFQTAAETIYSFNAFSNQTYKS